MSRADAAKIWSLNYRLLLSVISSVEADLTALGVDSRREATTDGLAVLSEAFDARLGRLTPSQQKGTQEPARTNSLTAHSRRRSAESQRNLLGFSLTRHDDAEALRAVVPRNTEQVQGQGDLALFDELFAEHFVDHTQQPGTTPDKAGVGTHLGDFLGIAPPARRFSSKRS
jgi:hypothetical protein